MLAIRGIYDGKQVKVSPSETLPQVDHEVAVVIVFWEDLPIPQPSRTSLFDVAQRMRTARDRMPPLGMSVKDLVEAGRER